MKNHFDTNVKFNFLPEKNIKLIFFVYLQAFVVDFFVRKRESGENPELYPQL